MKKIKIAPISYEHKRGQKTQIPINILVDILITLGYKKNNNEQIMGLFEPKRYLKTVFFPVVFL